MIIFEILKNKEIKVIYHYEKKEKNINNKIIDKKKKNEYIILVDLKDIQINENYFIDIEFIFNKTNNSNE